MRGGCRGRGDVTLSCGGHGRVAASIDVASFGVTRGHCGAYQGGCDCESKAALRAFTDACVGRESCTVEYTPAFAGAGCESGSGLVLFWQKLRN